MSAASLAIVVVTWNCRDLALQCLGAAVGSDVTGGLEIMVVDNASSDGTVAAIADRFPSVRVIVNAQNAGFAAACNQGLRDTAAPFILLLNPDAFPAAQDSFARLLTALEARPTFAAVGPRLLSEDGSHQVGDAGFRPSLRSAAAWSFGLHRFFRGFVLAGPPQPGVRDVDWLCGAAMLIRRAAFEQCGGLDERFFMYAEDMEWGCRLRDHGWRLGYVGATEVLHLQGGTQGGDRGDAKIRLVRLDWLDSLGLLLLARAGRPAWPWFWRLLWLGFWLRSAAYALRDSRKATAMGMFARHCWVKSRAAPQAFPERAAVA